jgi:hypothetical protein
MLWVSGHSIIVALAGLNKHFFMALAQFEAERPSFDKPGASANDRDNLHASDEKKLHLPATTGPFSDQSIPASFDEARSPCRL